MVVAVAVTATNGKHVTRFVTKNTMESHGILCNLVMEYLLLVDIVVTDSHCVMRATNVWTMLNQQC